MDLFSHCGMYWEMLRLVGDTVFLARVSHLEGGPKGLAIFCLALCR